MFHQNFREKKKTLLLLLLWTKMSFASGQLEPIVIHSDYAEFNTKYSEATHSGSVIASQGENLLISDILKIIQDKKHQLQIYIAQGTSRRAFFKINKKQKIGGPELIAHADIIKYYPNFARIDLIGHAEVQQDINRIKSDYLIYYIGEKRLISFYNPVQQTILNVKLK